MSPSAGLKYVPNWCKLEKAGYDPHDWIHYPDNIQTAEGDSHSANCLISYGGEANGTSRSGHAPNQ